MRIICAGATVSDKCRIASTGGPMPFDIEKYRKFVSHFDLNEKQQDDLIHTMYRSMENFADRAFGLDAVQQLIETESIKDAANRGPVIELEANDILNNNNNES